MVKIYAENSKLEMINNKAVPFGILGAKNKVITLPNTS